MYYILLVLGFILLIKGADFFVDGASSIAKLLKVPPVLIGLTIVAFGTSSPEGAVSIRAAINGNNGLSLGNIIGSNMFNMSLVIGIAAIIIPLKVEMQTIKKEIPFTLLAAIVVEILMADVFLNKQDTNMLSRSDGLVLLCFFIIFMYYLFEVAMKSRENYEEEFHEVSKGKSIIYTIAGLIAILVGGDLVVKSSSKIALAFGMSETLVAITIVSLGTSLPELITCVTAARKGYSDMAVGNIVGSNIFNTLFVLGTSATINPLVVESGLNIDVGFMVIYTFLLLIFSILHYKIVRWEGALLVLSYGGYIVYVLGNK
ncbi:calcium/sodium antiporter [Anaeromicrobium sediminis]|uniref:Sodium:proton exchanger n=1 Tax=Anaeromicrobium sediminis TaxID=1478221 RepID=A0A267MHQ1_9FIRM|nr:calcium/sodium antiporter [Anaeromicrobium sediminis]PAB58458.1 sodium:proton exchanger [Anaeromicrobium sediminis]